MSEKGVGYDSVLKTLIKVELGTPYVEFEGNVAEGLDIDLAVHKLEINHRYPKRVGERMKYVLIPIKNDNDMFLLIDLAIEMGKGQCEELFIGIFPLLDDGSLPSVNGPGLGVYRPIRRNIRDAKGPSTGLISSHGDSNSGISNIFDGASNDFTGGREMEVTLSFFLHSGGNGYITFEEEHRNCLDYWSFSDELKKEMRWDTKEQLVHVVKMHHIMNHHDYTVVKSNKKLWSVKCVNAEVGCSWCLRACKKKNDDKFEISIVEGPHTCVNPVLSNDHKQLDSILLGKAVVNHVRNVPDIAVSLVRTVVSDKFGYDFTWKRTYAAKNKAVVDVFGDWDDSYRILPNLLNAIKEDNVGTMIEWDYCPRNVEGFATFQRVFWEFGPCIKAFPHLRPLISVDGTFLYGKYRHKLLIACGMDDANHIVPLAFALVDEESRASWSWFLVCLKKYVVEDAAGPICLISDRHAGIRASVDDVDVGWGAPFAQWRFCIRHVSNYNDHVKNIACKEGVMKAAMQAQPFKCMKYLELVSQRKENALDYLNDIPKEQWTLSHDGGYRFGYMTTILSESYNAILKGVRKLPVASLVKKTFYSCVGYFRARKAETAESINREERYTRHSDDMLSRWMAVASKHSVTMFSNQNGLFDITTGSRNTSRGFKGGHRHILHLKAEKCTCNK